LKIKVTCFPIDQSFMAHIGIYRDSKVPRRALGDILLALIDEGYTNISSHVAEYEDERTLNFHCKKVTR